MKIDTLTTSISELSTEEALELILERRRARRVVSIKKRAPAKTKVKRKTKKERMLEMLTELLEEQERRLDCTDGEIKPHKS